MLGQALAIERHRRRRPRRPAPPGCRASDRAEIEVELPRAPMRAPSAARMRPHDGSPPKIPDLTRLPPATARARSRASARSRSPSTSTTSSLLAPSPSAAMARARSAQISASAAREAIQVGAAPLDGPRARAPVGQRDHAVVGRHVAVDGDGVEAVLDGAGQRRLQHRGRDRRVGGDEAEHGRHLRVDHPRPLGDGDDLHRSAADVDGARRQLGAQVGGPDCLGRRQRRRRPATTPAPASRRRMRSTGSGEPMAPVDAVRTSSGVTRSAGGRRRGHRALVDRAARPGQRVGVAAVGDDGADPHRGQAPGRVRHRRGAHAVDGEHAGGGARRLGDHQRPGRGAPARPTRGRRRPWRRSEIPAGRRPGELGRSLLQLTPEIPARFDAEFDRRDSRSDALTGYGGRSPSRRSRRSRTSSWRSAPPVRPPP